MHSKLASESSLSLENRKHGKTGKGDRRDFILEWEYVPSVPDFSRYDWAVVDARVKNKPCPVGLDPGVVQERHHALNWLIGYMDQEWDDVATDT